ncbi:MAG: hypothetical protein JNL80_05265 [Phycisphaerae bacterium]|nr:hypothetical protein [Phycisphaerae bacterium]
MGPLAAVSYVGVRMGLLLLGCGIAGCASDQQTQSSSQSSQGSLQHGQPGIAGTSYFASPQEAVARTASLLKAKNWAALATYYDLSGSTIDRAELVSGAFFYGPRTEGMHHPAGFDRYRHPFPPEFSFERMDATERNDVTEVITTVSIDQGDGRIQRGFAAALLRRSDRGWQWLPDAVHE